MSWILGNNSSCLPCGEISSEDEKITCVQCKHNFHFDCAGYDESSFRKHAKSLSQSWKCSTCSTVIKVEPVEAISSSSTANLSSISVSTPQSSSITANNLGSSSRISHSIPASESIELPAITKYDLSVAAEMISELPPESKNLLTCISSVFEKHISVLTAVIAQQFADYKKSLEAMKIVVDQCKSELKECKGNCQLNTENSFLRSEIKNLKKDVGDLHSYSRRCNLQIIGLPENENEDMDIIRSNLLHELNLNHLNEAVTAMCRVPISRRNRLIGENEIKPIIMQFDSKRNRDICFSASQNKQICASVINPHLRQNPVYLSNHLPPNLKFEKIFMMDKERSDLVEGKSSSDAKSTEEPDPYLYTKLDFTSEIYKIEVGNLPNCCGYGQLRKLLNVKLKLNAHKIKAVGSPSISFAFVTFKNENDRDNALKCLQGYQWKKKTLSAKKANPMADPMACKRKAGDAEDSVPIKKSKDENEGETISTMLKNVVTPLWNVPYAKQLENKDEEVQRFVIKLGRGIQKINKGLMDAVNKNRQEKSRFCCPIMPIKPSPVTEAYRNKCEFTVGKDLLTKERTVGFRLNRYKKGSMSVAAPDECINVSSRMLKAVKVFQSYVQKSDKEVYNPEDHSGYWRQLTVKTSKKDILLIIVMHPQQLTQSDLQKEMDSLKEFFENGDGKSCGATSGYFKTFDKVHAEYDEKSSLIHLFGKKHMEEELLGMTFQISPESFFQVNSAAAEELYQTVAEKVGHNSSSTVLDICCGTGTIGLYLAKQGAKVIGVEMCPQAVENAKENARINDISTIDFMCGKAEDIITDVICRSNASEIVAIADPPRAGLHPRVIKKIRSFEEIKKLVYVSCNPNAAFQNFIDLCRPTSNNFRGSPFYPCEVSPIDMFPQTPHYELVIVFERQTEL